MENNTLVSNELEQMRAQIGALKEKLDKQAIINDQHIRRSMKSRMSDINKTVTATIFLGVFALVYNTWFFYRQGCSIGFTILTGLMLAVCLGLTIVQKINLGKMDLSKGNLVETASYLSKLKRHYQNWYKIAIPMLVIWFALMMYEMTQILDLKSSMAIGFYCGAATGAIIGGIAGFRINKKVVRKATEILEQIEELQRQQ